MSRRSGIHPAPGLRRVRAARAPIASVLLTVYLAALFAPALAWAAPAAGPAIARLSPSARELSTDPASETVPLSPRDSIDPRTLDGAAAAVARAQATLGVAPTPTDMTGLTFGGDKSGLSSGAVSLPQGPGKVQGLGESFSAQLSTGVAAFSVSIAVPTGRGPTVSLALAYSSAGRHGNAGIGWDLSTPYIARQTDRGRVSYDDATAAEGWKPTQDRFVYGGGGELVPLCVVRGGACSATPGEPMPSWADGWTLYRTHIEGSYVRAYFSPDHETWRVVDGSGTTSEFGVALDGRADRNALEVDPLSPSRVFRWNVSRQYDVHGVAPTTSAARPQPYNEVRWRYVHDGELAYVSDVYALPPSGQAGAASGSFAHHVHLVWNERPDVKNSWRRGYPTREALRLGRVEVTSRAFAAPDGDPRKLVRRVHLSYAQDQHLSLLSSVNVEGRCASSEAAETRVEGSAGILAPVTGPECPTLPPMTFGYGHVQGTSIVAGPVGHEPFATKVQELAGAPGIAIDDDRTDFFDVNGDGLPDLVSTDAARYQGRHGLYLLGKGGVANTFGAPEIMAVGGLPNVDALTLSLTNANVAPLDIDADGRPDLVHSPAPQTMNVFSPTYDAAARRWTWFGRNIANMAATALQVDFGRDAEDLRAVDVNADGFTDIVRTGGQTLDTYFGLGRLPGGAGRWGTGKWLSASTSGLSAAPVRACVPMAGFPMRFGDEEVKVGDMNGDGFPDLVRLQAGLFRYWPGHGDGSFGTTRECAAGTFPSMTFVELRREFAPIVPAQLSVADVTGDGLDDVIQVRNGNVDVWVNEGGERLLPRITLVGLPWSQGIGQRFRLHDVNGNGTPDLFWGDPNHYRFVDVLGGKRPWLLERVENGLGKSTELTYAPSTELMLAAERAGTPWSTKMPTVQWVITKKTERDNLGRAGREDGVYTTDYAYRDPVYEGRARDFRGFSWASSTERGTGAGGRAKVTETAFELGSCVDDAKTFGVDACALEGRWKDQPREALKGRPLYTLTRDDAGTVLEVSAGESDVRLLATGLDGREVRAVVPRRSHAWKFDTAAYAAGGAPVVVSAHRMLDASGNLQAVVPVSVPVPGSRYAHLVTEEDVDLEAHVVAKRAMGCTEGALCTGTDETITAVTTWTRVGPESLLWAQTYGYVQGTSTGATKWKESFVDVDALGRPVATRAVLAGTVDVDRRHAVSGKAVAPAPSNRSQNRTLTTSELAYDAVGHVVLKKAPAGACVATSYEAVYGDAVVLEQVASGDPSKSGVGVAGAAGQPCGPSTLTRAASHDRGLGQPVRTVNEAGEPTQVSYDGLGRLVTVTVPNAASPGQLAAEPQLLVEWALPGAGEVLTKVHTQTRVGPGVYRQGYSVSDGLGRTLGAVAEANDGDPGPWVVSGTVTFDDFGRPWRMHVPFFSSGDPAQAATTRGVTYAQTDQDTFGRVLTEYNQDGTGTSPGSVKARVVHHALSTDTWDAEDLQVSGPHYGSYATSEVDGHGRAKALLERVRVGATLEERATEKSFLPTGEVRRITRRVRNNAAAPVVDRWVRFDTLGRMVANADPNTTVVYTSAEPSDLPAGSAQRLWRYAYDDAGQLVGTSDARGCGVNFQYDAAGRVLTEDHSPCTADHPNYTAPTPGTCTGYEVCTRYDSADPDAATVKDAIGRGLMVLGSYAGRVASVTDKAQKTVLAYDGRGRVTGRLKRVALVDATNPSRPKQLAPRAYLQQIAYDEANRVVTETTGVTSTALQGAGGTSSVTSVWDKRGAVSAVTSSYGDLVKRVSRDAQGRVMEIVYADAAATTTQMVYDSRGRLVNTQTFRSKPSWWAAGGAGAPASYKAPGTSELVSQAILESRSVTYDEADNPVLIADSRTASEWPAGALPVTKRMSYDDAYRVTRVEYLNPSGASITAGSPTTDTWVDPFDAEDRATPLATSASTATANPRPVPHVKLPTRVKREDYAYDSLGNILTSSDDANAFWDRSLGAQTHGTTAAGPYQLRSATNRTTASGSLYKGGLEAQYDAAGNLTAMIVQRDAASTTALPSGASLWQRYAYAWDEVGRLMTASRWDLKTSTTATANERTNSGTLAQAAPTRRPDARMAYLYDGADERVVKTTTDAAGASRHTVDVYANYKLRLTKQAGTGTLADYTLDGTTEQVELQSHGVTVARVEVMPTTASTVTTPGQRTLLVLHDALGSAGIVLDRATGQLAEAITYTAYGQTESDLRPTRFTSSREDERFTGKEEDVEIGLVYFGKRYLVPAMARWASADPLAVHAPGEADLNLYAYVHGRVYVAVDPLGLEAFKEEGIGTDEEIRATVAAGYKGGSIRADERNGETKRQLEEWIETGSVTMVTGKERAAYKVDRAIGQLLANLAKASSADMPTEILSLGRAPTEALQTGHGRWDRWIEAVDISRVAGDRTDLSVGSLPTNADKETWDSRKSEAIRGTAKLLSAMPKALFDVGTTRPGVPFGWVDPDSNHHPFINQLEGHPNGCKGGACTSLSQSLKNGWMSTEAQAVLGPVVDKMVAFVRSAYPDGADHAHVQRSRGVHTR